MKGAFSCFREGGWDIWKRFTNDGRMNFKLSTAGDGARMPSNREGVSGMKKIFFAVLFYLSALNLFASPVEDYYKLALSQYLGNHYSNAVPNLKWAIRLDENDSRAH